MDTKRTRRPIDQPSIAAVLFLLLLTPRCASAQSPPQSDSRGGYYNNGRFSPTMAVIIVAMISAFFFLGFFSIYLRSCGGDEESLSFRRRTAAGRSRRQQQGLSLDVIETFPTMVYSEVKGLKVGKGALECAVCLCEFEDDEELRLLPHCNHVFHPDCIGAWLAAHVTCPVCRANLTEQATAASADPSAPPIVAQEAPGAPAPDYVAIAVDLAAEEEEKKEAAVELAQIGSQQRAARSRSGRRPASFPRSHSTGHSIIRLVEDADRFTLRLPEHIRKEILVSRKFYRSASCISFPTPNEGSSRSGRRGRSRPERSIQLGKSERWPSFLFRNLSIKIPAWATGKRGEGEGEGSASGSGSVRKGEIDVSGMGTASYPRALSEGPGASDAFASTATAIDLESPASRRRPKSPRPT